MKNLKSEGKFHSLSIFNLRKNFLILLSIVCDKDASTSTSLTHPTQYDSAIFCVGTITQVD